MKKEDRIKELIELWRKNNGRGRIILPNQFGKQLLLSKVLELFLDKNPSSEVFIITQNYSSSYQWNMWLYTQKLHNKCKAYSISYILSNLSTFTKFPFLIIDDITNEKSLYSILKIPYKFLLSITSFYDLNYLKSLPIVGEITKEEAISNKWINNYKVYKEYEKQLSEWEMDQQFSGDDSHEDVEGDNKGFNDFLSGYGIGSRDVEEEEEEDLSKLKQSQIQSMIDDALDREDYTEVARISKYLKEGKEIYLKELERVNESYSRRKNK